jgi:hypothetical protein
MACPEATHRGIRECRQGNHRPGTLACIEVWGGKYKHQGNRAVIEQFKVRKMIVMGEEDGSTWHIYIKKQHKETHQTLFEGGRKKEGRMGV